MHAKGFLVEGFCITLGILLSYVYSIPIQDKKLCDDGWTYGRYMYGYGCLKQLSNQFTRKNCLMEGYHLTLLTQQYTHDSIICVKDEEPEPRPSQRPNSDVSPKSATTKPNGDSFTNMKIKPGHMIEESQESRSKVLACCMPGINGH